MRKRSKSRTWARRFALVAVSTLASVVLLEAALRVLRGDDRFFPYYPNSARQFFPSEAITPGITGVSNFTTNSFGTRGREPDGRERLRVLTVGGSTTACTVLDDTESWPAVLERCLDDVLGGAGLCWVANSGVDGLNSHHHLMHAKYLLPRLPPVHLVIIHAGINDLGMWFHQREFDPHYLEDPENWNSRIGEAFRWSNFTPKDWPFYKRMEIWKTLSRLKDRILSSGAQSQGGDDTRVIVQDSELRWLEEERRRRSERKTELLPQAKQSTLPVALDAYGDTLVKIAEEIREHGAKPIFMTQALQTVFASEEERARLWMGAVDGGDSYVSDEQYPVLLGAFNDRMRQVALEHDVPLMDLASCLDWTGSLFYDGMHFNEQGARVAAEAIAAFLVDNALLDGVRQK